MGLGLVALLIATQWVSLTGGMNGLAGVPNFVVFGFEAGTRFQKLIFIWCVVAAGALLSRQIMRGLYGLQYTIARENSTAAMSVGVNVSILRFTAFRDQCKLRWSCRRPNRASNSGGFASKP